MILGITGTDGSGKGTVVDYLVSKKGYKHYHVRALLIEEIKKQGLSDDRSQMRLVANELRKEHGNDYVVRFFIDQARKNKDKNIIVDSIRALAEAKYLKKEDGILIAVNADQEIRYTRVQERRSETDKVTFEAFVDHEKLEMHDPDPHGMQKQKVIDMADYTLNNNGTIEGLHQQIEEMLIVIDKVK